MNVQSIMTTEVVSVSPNTTLTEAARLLRDESVGSLLVLEDSRLVGILSDRDVAVRAIAQGWHPEEHRVSEIMTADPITINASDDPLEAAKVIGSAHVRRLPVLQDGNVVGIISAADVADYVEEALAGLFEEMEKAIH